MASNVIRDLLPLCTASKPPSEHIDFDQSALHYRFICNDCIYVVSTCGTVLENLQTRCCFSWILIKNTTIKPFVSRMFAHISFLLSAANEKVVVVFTLCSLQWEKTL